MPAIIGKSVIKSDVEQLECNLSTGELAERSQQLAEAVAELRRHQAEAADIKAGLSAKDKKLQSEVDKLATVVKEKKERRSVEIQIEAVSYDRCVVVRLDTYKQIRERPMTQAEMQLELPVGERLDLELTKN